eukprot:3454310-Lingulodinium_polyedra.AAC.1
MVVVVVVATLGSQSSTPHNEQRRPSANWPPSDEGAEKSSLSTPTAPIYSVATTAPACSSLNK